MQINLVKNIEGLNRAVTALKGQGRVGFVPTMGALHAGHASLMTLGLQHSKNVAVSVFVNPTQFGPNEDFGKYPRMLEKDVETAANAGASVVFAPSVEEMYPEGQKSTLSAGKMGTVLDGAFRPGHFDGVATVVARLLRLVGPDVAVFGEKDYQQLCVIRRMVQEQGIDVQIIGAPTMREPDGLAMSSRNLYLTPEERKLAPAIYRALLQVAEAVKAGAGPKKSIAEGIDKLSSLGFKLDYLELCDAATLEPVESLEKPARLLVAAWLGKTRLIDNIAVG